MDKCEQIAKLWATQNPHTTVANPVPPQNLQSSKNIWSCIPILQFDFQPE
jgi:hypothetical protein